MARHKNFLNSDRHSGYLPKFVVVQFSPVNACRFVLYFNPSFYLCLTICFYLCDVLFKCILFQMSVKELTFARVLTTYVFKFPYLWHTPQLQFVLALQNLNSRLCVMLSTGRKALNNGM